MTKAYVLVDINIDDTDGFMRYVSQITDLITKHGGRYVVRGAVPETLLDNGATPQHIAVLEFAYYSVISPEGCAGILWKSQSAADKAALALKFTSKDLLKLGVIDEIVPEPLGGAHRNHRAMAMTLKGSISAALDELTQIPVEELLDRRYEKFRRIGVFDEGTLAG